MVKLTKRAVDAFAAGADERVAWDDDLAGFGLRIFPSGRKTYVLKYRNAAGRQRWLTLGQHGALTPDQARRMAQDRLGEVRHGADPVDERHRARAAPTVGDLLDRYVAEHVAVRNKPSTRASVEWIIRKELRPRLGRLKTDAVTHADVARLHSAMAATPRQANLAVAYLSKAMGLAETWRLRPKGSNPCRGIEKFPEASRDRYLTAEELPRLGKALRDAAEREHPRSLAAILLLILTGRRLSEVCGLRWDAVDLRKGAVRLAETKSGKAQHHALNADAAAVLERLPREAGSPWVLPMIADPTRPMPGSTVEQAWQRVRKAADLEDVRLHDLRHTVGTYAAQTGGNAFLIRDMLGHQTVAMTGRYVSRDVEPVRALADQVGARISAGLGLDRGEDEPRPVPVTATYDPKAEVLTVRLAEGDVAKTEEAAGLAIGRDAEGRIVSLVIAGPDIPGRG